MADYLMNSDPHPLDIEDDDLEYEDEDEEDLEDVTEEDDSPIGKDDVRDDPRITNDPYTL